MVAGHDVRRALLLRSDAFAHHLKGEREAGDGVAQLVCEKGEVLAGLLFELLIARGGIGGHRLLQAGEKPSVQAHPGREFHPRCVIDDHVDQHLEDGLELEDDGPQIRSTEEAVSAVRPADPPRRGFQLLQWLGELADDLVEKARHRIDNVGGRGDARAQPLLKPLHPAVDDLVPALDDHVCQFRSAPACFLHRIPRYQKG